MEASQDDRYREAAAAYGAALERLAGADQRPTQMIAATSPGDLSGALAQFRRLGRALLAGLVVFSAGITPHRVGGMVGFVLVLLAFSGFVVWRNRRTAIRLDRRIAELDNLESQS